MIRAGRGELHADPRHRGLEEHRRGTFQHGPHRGRPLLAVVLLGPPRGIYFGRNGRIKLSYGDHGSGCCQVVTVRRPNRTTLVAHILPYPWGDEGEPGARVYGESSFGRHGEVHRDRTAPFWFPPPRE